MTSSTIEASAPPLIRIPNLGGAIVRVIEVKQESSNRNLSDYKFAGQCAGCLATEGSTAVPQDLSRTRAWAGKHAATCRALPPVTDEQPVSSVYLAEARDVIEQAREAVAWAAPGQGRAEALSAVAQSMTAFALAAQQIEA